MKEKRDIELLWKKSLQNGLSLKARAIREIELGTELSMSLVSKVLRRKLREEETKKMEAPKTKAMVAVLENLGLDQQVLILLPGQDEAVEKSARNLPQVKTLQAGYLNIRDLLKYDHVLVPLDALRVIENILG